MVAVEVRQGTRTWLLTVEAKEEAKEKDKEKEEEKEKTTYEKSNNPHLTGGEKHMNCKAANHRTAFWFLFGLFLSFCP